MKYFNKNDPMHFYALTKVEGSLIRHVEQLWDEIHKLKERISLFEKKND